MLLFLYVMCRSILKDIKKGEEKRNVEFLSFNSNYNNSNKNKVFLKRKCGYRYPLVIFDLLESNRHLCGKRSFCG